MPFITFFQNFPAWDIPILTFLFGVLSTLCFLFIKRYLAASDDFRSAVHTNLVGIYPTIEYISIEQKDITLHSSIGPIKIAGFKFKRYLPFFCLGRFDRALNNYCETAKNINWNEQLAYQMYPPMAKDISPKEKLDKAIKELLKFAK